MPADRPESIGWIFFNGQQAISGSEMLFGNGKKLNPSILAVLAGLLSKKMDSRTF